MNEQKDKIRISETFTSFQGENIYTGRNSVWIRFFGCNLQCDGFGQGEPTVQSTYELPYKTFDVSDIKKMEDLPVFDKGCDSGYSWSKKYKHLTKQYTSSELIDELETLMQGTLGRFVSNKSKPGVGFNRHLCFTGGEPLLKANQNHIISILNELEMRDNLPKDITIETNATQILSIEFVENIKYYQKFKNINFHASCSPKLFNVSGETNDKAWNFEAIHQYHELFNELSIKPVMTNDDKAWDELDVFLSKIKFDTCNVYVMPVGATVEQQSENVIAQISDRALNNGFNVSGRLHCYVYGNTIGT